MSAVCCECGWVLPKCGDLPCPNDRCVTGLRAQLATMTADRDRAEAARVAAEQRATKAAYFAEAAARYGEHSEECLRHDRACDCGYGEIYKEACAFLGRSVDGAFPRAAVERHAARRGGGQ